MSRTRRNAGYLVMLTLFVLWPAGVGADGPYKAITFRHTRRLDGVFRHAREVKSPDGKVVLKAEGKMFKRTVRLYDVETGKPLGPAIQPVSHPELNSYKISALAVGPDNRTVAIADGYASNDSGSVLVWDARTGKKRTHYDGSDTLGEVFTLSFSADGRTLSITSGQAGGR